LFSASLFSKTTTTTALTKQPLMYWTTSFSFPRYLTKTQKQREKKTFTFFYFFRFLDNTVQATLFCLALILR